MAREMMDIRLDDDEDLDTSTGDFRTVESTYKHQQNLLLNAKGDFKESPTVCVATNEFIDGEGKAELQREIKRQFVNDGMTVHDLSPNPQAETDSTVRIFNNSFYGE
jgi:hypothetical protein